MMRAGTALTLLCLGLFWLFLSPDAGAQTQTAAAGIKLAQVLPPESPPPRRRQRLRVVPYETPDGVYPRYDPGPNAVRECNATYVQEYRPSGTVIVPRLSCYWRRG
jgi:hypothetical protein